MRTRQASRSERVLARAQREHEPARLAIVQLRWEEDIHCLVPVKSRRLVGSHLLADSLGLGRRRLAGIRLLAGSLGLGWAEAADIHGHDLLLVARCHAAAAAGQQQLVADRSRTRACGQTGRSTTKRVLSPGRVKITEPGQWLRGLSTDDDESKKHTHDRDTTAATCSSICARSATTSTS